MDDLPRALVRGWRVKQLLVDMPTTADRSQPDHTIKQHYLMLSAITWRLNGQPCRRSARHRGMYQDSLPSGSLCVANLQSISLWPKMVSILAVAYIAGRCYTTEY